MKKSVLYFITHYYWVFYRLPTEKIKTSDHLCYERIDYKRFSYRQVIPKIKSVFLVDETTTVTLLSFHFGEALGFYYTQNQHYINNKSESTFLIKNSIDLSFSEHIWKVMGPAIEIGLWSKLKA